MDTGKEMFEYLGMAGLPPGDVAKFVERFSEHRVSCPFTIEKYHDNQDLLEVVRMLRMDPDKFYYLVLFLYDYTCDVCFNGVEIEQGGHEMMWMLIERGRLLIEGKTPPPIKTDASCNFKIQGRNYKVTDVDSIATLLYWIHRGMIQMSSSDKIWELNWLIDDYENHETRRNESVSVAIWCFASLLLEFFKLNAQFKGRAPKGSGLSLNKQLLTSNLIYSLGLSRNESFLYSAETLKGFMRQYKNRPLPKSGKIYGGKKLLF